VGWGFWEKGDLEAVWLEFWIAGKEFVGIYEFTFLDGTTTCEENMFSGLRVGDDFFDVFGFGSVCDFARCDDDAILIVCWFVGLEIL